MGPLVTPASPDVLSVDRVNALTGALRWRGSRGPRGRSGCTSGRGQRREFRFEASAENQHWSPGSASGKATMGPDYGN